MVGDKAEIMEPSLEKRAVSSTPKTVVLWGSLGQCCVWDMRTYGSPWIWHKYLRGRTPGSKMEHARNKPNL